MPRSQSGPKINNFLQETLLAGWSNKNPNLDHYSPMFDTLKQQQTQIGLFLLMKGFWSLEWETLNTDIL